MEETYNTRLYGHLVRPHVNNTHDYYWVCNQMAKMYKHYEGHIADNARISKDFNESWDEGYQKAKDSGCCGYDDRLVWNPKTGNSFWIGFNYGH